MIGIISDTHEQEEAIKKAVEIFKEKEVDFVVHCGDFISPPTLEHFKGLNMIFVFGNNDGEKKGLNKKAKELGFLEITETKKFDYKGKKFFVCHGHRLDELQKAIKSAKYDYVLTGHTHLKRTARAGKTMILNPGSLFGEPKTIATLDAENSDVEFEKID